MLENRKWSRFCAAVAFTFPVTKRHRLLTATTLLCLVTQQFAQGHHVVALCRVSIESPTPYITTLSCHRGSLQLQNSEETSVNSERWTHVDDLSQVAHVLALGVNNLGHYAALVRRRTRSRLARAPATDAAGRRNGAERDGRRRRRRPTVLARITSKSTVCVDGRQRYRFTDEHGGRRRRWR